MNQWPSSLPLRNLSPHQILADETGSQLQQGVGFVGGIIIDHHRGRVKHIFDFPQDCVPMNWAEKGITSGEQRGIGFMTLVKRLPEVFWLVGRLVARDCDPCHIDHQDTNSHASKVQIRYRFSQAA